MPINSCENVFQTSLRFTCHFQIRVLCVSMSWVKEKCVQINKSLLTVLNFTAIGKLFCVSMLFFTIHMWFSRLKSILKEIKINLICSVFFRGAMVEKSIFYECLKVLLQNHVEFIVKFLTADAFVGLRKYFSKIY